MRILYKSMEVELQGAQENREAEVIQESHEHATVAQRKLKVKQFEGKTNTDFLVNKQVHHGANVGAIIMKTRVPVQEGAEGNVVERDAFACEVIFKWKSVIKEDMDTQSSMCMLSNGFRQSNDDSNILDRIFKVILKVHHGLNVGAVIMKTRVPGQDGVEGNAAEKYRGDNNMAAFGVAAVIEEYAHESLTLRDAIACEVIFKWISVMKEDMDTRSSMYYMGFTYESKNGIWVTKGLLDEAKEIILGMEISRTQSGNTLRVSRFRFFNGMSIQILLGGHSTLSLEGGLSGNRDEEKKKSRFEQKLVAGITTCALTKVVPVRGSKQLLKLLRIGEG
nr:zinc finger, CCHC-type [Tanacetum cinerariifolium]